MRLTIGSGAVLCALWLVSPLAGADDKEKTAADEKAVRQCNELYVKAFNSGQAKEFAVRFTDNAELVDENGTVYKGRGELEKLYEQFFQKFSGAKLQIKIDAIRFVGPNVAIEESSHTVTTKDGSSEARHRYVCVLNRQGNDWLICSAREYPDDASLTPHDRLQPLAWMVGDWVDEDPESVVMLSCRWSKDKNYLLCDYTVQVKGKKVMESTQRIGWDPLRRQIRSWVFDSDGGFSHAAWTQDDKRWVMKSTGVLPDGSTGSATFTITPQGKDKFLWKSTDRVAGDAIEPDFEVVIARKPPAAK
jgi:uncharacterized protein (TIGR02246 family)